MREVIAQELVLAAEELKKPNDGGSLLRKQIQWSSLALVWRQPISNSLGQLISETTRNIGAGIAEATPMFTMYLLLPYG